MAKKCDTNISIYLSVIWNHSISGQRISGIDKFGKRFSLMWEWDIGSIYSSVLAYFVIVLNQVASHLFGFTVEPEGV